MARELATVKAHVSDERNGGHPDPSRPAEELRLRFADAWGEMSAAWGVAPAIGRVHAYLMVRDEPLTDFGLGWLQADPLTSQGPQTPFSIDCAFADGTVSPMQAKPSSQAASASQGSPWPCCEVHSIVIGSQ